MLALDGELIGKVLVTTSLAGAAGGVASALFTRVSNGKWDVAMMANGILAGLVGITAGADVVGNAMAVLVGLIAGALVVLAVGFFDRIKIDDPVGAISVHGVCGILGTLWVGLAATEGGLLFGGGADLFVSQLIGVIACIAWVGVTSAVMFGTLKAMGQLRVTEQEEVEGLDVWEHGVPGYPEQVFGSGSSPSGTYGFESSAATAPAAKPVED